MGPGIRRHEHVGLPCRQVEQSDIRTPLVLTQRFNRGIPLSVMSGEKDDNIIIIGIVDSYVSVEDPDTYDLLTDFYKKVTHTRAARNCRHIPHYTKT